MPQLSSHRASQSVLDQDKHVFELSTGQLLSLVIVMIFFWLGCFVVGILVYRLDARSSANLQMASSMTPGQASPSAPEPSATRPTGATSNQAVGTQTSPRPDILKNTPPAAVMPTTKQPTETTTEAPRVVDLPPSGSSSTEPQARLDPPPVPPDRPTKSTAAKSAENDVTVEAPKTTPAEAKSPPAEPTQIASLDEMTPDDEPTATAKPAAATKPAVPAATAASGKYAIQVASFRVADRAKAEAFQKDLKAKSTIDSNLVISKDGAYVQVLVGAFETREAAIQEKESLSKKSGFGDCFVRPI